MYLSILIPTLYSQGAEYVAACMARGFAEAGHRVDVVVSALQRDLEAQTTDRKPFALGANIRLVYLPHRRARHNILALRQYIQQNRPDVILNNAAPFTPALALARLLLPKTFPTKVVHVEHLGGIGLDAEGNPIQPRASLRTELFYALLRRYDAILVVSQGTGEALHRLTGYPLSRIFTVYNPALDDVARKKMSAPPSHPWLASKTCPTFVAAGAFCPAKNYPNLLRAFAKVRVQHPCRLVIFGNGPLKSEYERLIKELNLQECVSLPGYTDNLPAEIKAADAFIVSSNIESFSIVLTEALAAGTPVISTDAPYGPPEILQGGKYGILVKRNDPDALAAGILQVLNGHAILPTPEAYERFTLSNTVKRYEAALATLFPKP